MTRTRGPIPQQNAFEDDFAGPLSAKERSFTLQDMYDLTFKYEGMKTRVSYDAANATQTGKWYELKAQALCDLGLGAWGTVLAHWRPLGDVPDLSDFIQENEPNDVNFSAGGMKYFGTNKYAGEYTLGDAAKKVYTTFYGLLGGLFRGFYTIIKSGNNSFDITQESFVSDSTSVSFNNNSLSEGGKTASGETSANASRVNGSTTDFYAQIGHSATHNNTNTSTVHAAGAGGYADKTKAEYKVTLQEGAFTTDWLFKRDAIYKNGVAYGGNSSGSLGIPYEPGLVLTAGQSIVGDGIILVVNYDVTTSAATIYDEYNLPDNHWNYRLDGSSGVYSDISGANSGNVYTSVDSGYDEYHLHLKAGANVLLYFGADSYYKLFGRVMKQRIFIPANTTAAVNGGNHHYFPGTPTIASKLYTVDTVLEYDFIAERDPSGSTTDPGNPVIKFRYIQPGANISGTTTGGGGPVYAEDVITNSSYQFVNQTQIDNWDRIQTPLAKSGTVCTFEQDSGHGSATNPVTGNITIDNTGYKLHTVCVLHHNAPTAPTLDGKMYPYDGSADYAPGVLNTIWIMCEGATSFGYIIRQKAGL